VNATTGYGRLEINVMTHGDSLAQAMKLEGSTTTGLTTVTIPDNLVVNGNVDLGSNTSDTVSFSGLLDTNILPTVDTENENAPQRNLGSTVNKFSNVYATNFNGNATTATTATYVTNLKSDASTNLTTDNLTEGTGNLYFTNTRARSAVSVGSNNAASGSGGISYDNSTGVFTFTPPEIPTSVSNATTANKVKTNAASGTIYILGSDNSSAANSEDVYVASGLSYDVANDELGATSTKAKYADLAENYLGDSDYEPGTVLVFGGEAELTTTQVKGDRKVAGVVTTNPAHLMNGALEGDHVIGLALQGRVPCKVIGTVFKGDMLVTSAIPGYAVVDNDPKMGTVIGKAVETKMGDGKGVIEVVVGRL